MKLGDIKRACMIGKTIRILDCGENGIWLSNGQAAWPVPDMGWDEKNVPAIFDLTEKERNGMVISSGFHPQGDWGILGPRPEEVPLWPVQPLGETLILSTEKLPRDGDVIMVWQHNIRPARSKDVTTEFFIRCWGDSIVVVGYNGVETSVITMPLSVGQVARIQENLAMLAGMPIRDTGWAEEEKE